MANSWRFLFSSYIPLLHPYFLVFFHLVDIAGQSRRSIVQRIRQYRKRYQSAAHDCAPATFRD